MKKKKQTKATPEQFKGFSMHVYVGSQAKADLVEKAKDKAGERNLSKLILSLVESYVNGSPKKNEMVLSEKDRLKIRVGGKIIEIR